MKIVLEEIANLEKDFRKIQVMIIYNGKCSFQINEQQMSFWGWHNYFIIIIIFDTFRHLFVLWSTAVPFLNDDKNGMYGVKDLQNGITVSKCQNAIGVGAGLTQPMKSRVGLGWVMTQPNPSPKLLTHESDPHGSKNISRKKLFIFNLFASIYLHSFYV